MKNSTSTSRDLLDTNNDGAVDQLIFDRVEWTYEKKEGRMVRTAMKVIEEGLTTAADVVLVAIGFQGAEIRALREHRYRGDLPEHHQNGSQYDDEFAGSFRCGRCQPRSIHRGLGDRRRPRRRPMHRYLFDGQFPTAGESSDAKSTHRKAMNDSAETTSGARSLCRIQEIRSAIF